MLAVPRAVRPLVMLVTGLAMLLPTWLTWEAALDADEQEARLRFEAKAADIASQVRGRMLDYEQVLRGGIGLFAASEHVTRAEWRAYVQALALSDNYPGVRGVGFAPALRPQELDAHQAAARADGFPDYEMFYAGAPHGEVRVPVHYIEPFEGRNRKSFGFDMHSDRVRRAAIEQARDTGRAALTGRVMPAPGTEADPQAGVILFLPVYRRDAPLEGVPERRAAIAGFVYSPFRVGDLLAGTLGREPGADLRLFDATLPERIELLHEDRPVDRESRFDLAETLVVFGRLWRLEVRSRPSLEAEYSSSRPVLVLAGGLAISALVLLIVWNLLTTRERARELARSMTAALRQSEARLQLALESSRLAVFDWDVAAGLVGFSPEWSAMLGGAREATVTPAPKLTLMVHPEDVGTVQAEVGKLLAGAAESYRVEHRVRRADGAWLWIESTARATSRDAEGRALRVIGVNADIRERKAVEQLKDEFIASVSHELRTPLTSMLTSLALMREGSAGELPPDARRFVDIAYDNTERLAALVNDIIDIERIEAGHVDLEIAEVDAGALARRAAELNAGYAERCGTRFELDAPKTGPAIRADEDRLLQVLTNLLSNAAKHSPRGEPVTLKVEAIDGRVRLEVADRGPGIPAAFCSRIFGKFEQAEGEQGGTGLGLAISKALVERMQGRIGFDSEPGRGATFWVELPRA